MKFYCLACGHPNNYEVGTKPSVCRKCQTNLTTAAVVVPKSQPQPLEIRQVPDYEDSEFQTPLEPPEEVSLAEISRCFDLEEGADNPVKLSNLIKEKVPRRPKKTRKRKKS